MGSLLIGAEMDSASAGLDAKLRTATIEFAQKKFGRVIPTYSPWLCLAPLVDEIDPDLLYFKPLSRGSLVTDQRFLEKAAALLSGEGRAAIAELPGDPKVWLPNSTNISATFSDAISVINRSDSTVRSLFERTVDYVIPLGGGRNRGHSSHLVRGAVFRSLPAENDKYDVAIDIFHEVGHHVLMSWQSVDPILTSPLDAPVYSQIRRTDRPAIQSFHAAVALAYMLYLSRTLPVDSGMQAAAARRGASYSENLPNSLALATEAIRGSCTLTELGTAMIAEMEALV